MTPTILRIGHLSTAYHTALILIGGNWVEKKMEIDVRWTLFSTGPAMMKAFSHDEIDLGYIGLPPAMIAIEKGLPLKCVGGGHIEGTIIIGSPQIQTYEECGSMDATLQQFRGKTIGTPTRGSIHDVILRHLLRRYHLDSKVEVKNYPWADLILDALEKEEVQGGCGTPPLAVLGAQYARARIICPTWRIWNYNPSYGIVSTLRFLNTHSDHLEKFLKLHEEACNLIRNEPDQAATFAAKAIGFVEKEFLAKVYKVSPKYCASLPLAYRQSSLKFVPILKELGYIKRDLLDNEIFAKDIIKKIHREPPHYENPGVLA
jgi:NitT/TauT family transport system substrate-binding protein